MTLSLKITVIRFFLQAFDTAGHPLNVLVEGLVDVYRATYVGVGAHRRLLPHAVAEAKSYVTRLFNVLRFVLFSFKLAVNKFNVFNSLYFWLT